MNIKLSFQYYWPHIKRYKKSTVLTFLGYGIAVAGSGIAAPLLYKRIMDIVSGAENPADAGVTLIKPRKTPGSAW